MCLCTKTTYVSSTNDTSSDRNTGETEPPDDCGGSGLEVRIRIREVAHETGTTNYMDRMRITVNKQIIASVDSIVLNIDSGKKTDVTEYGQDKNGNILIDVGPPIEYDPMEDGMILSVVTRNHSGGSCIHNIYP